MSWEGFFLDEEITWAGYGGVSPRLHCWSFFFVVGMDDKGWIKACQGKIADDAWIYGGQSEYRIPVKATIRQFWVFTEGPGLLVLQQTAMMVMWRPAVGRHWRVFATDQRENDIFGSTVTVYSISTTFHMDLNWAITIRKRRQLSLCSFCWMVAHMHQCIYIHIYTWLKLHQVRVYEIEVRVWRYNRANLMVRCCIHN